ncbi:MAG: hypothetical protein MUF13_08545 [Akkermansiaceae bacterium]|nr:hypothetical protein [Akkermansiaceae bacterium]
MAEPAELTKLREQFRNRVAKELEPWNGRYAKELEKLEKSLASAGRLEEALEVRKEKEKVLEDIGQPIGGGDRGNPRNAEELSAAIEGTYWVVYAMDDKKHDVMMDVYQFRKGGIFVNLLHAKTPHAWKATSASKIKVQHSLGDFEITVDLNSAEGEVGYSFQAQRNVLILARTKPRP